MKLGVLVFLGVFGIAGASLADDAAQCQANGGAYLTGNVTAGPTFQSGHAYKGVELSHTHFTLLADQDGQSYDVAADNVFATGYDQAGENVPSPLSSITQGARLELCGQLYTTGGPGIHWVDTDCGETPTAAKPDGWLKVLGADGTPGPNLEDSQEYCSLWP